MCNGRQHVRLQPDMAMHMTPDQPTKGLPLEMEYISHQRPLPWGNSTVDKRGGETQDGSVTVSE